MQTKIVAEQNSNQRYRNLVISIAVFLLLIVALLFFTYVASQTLQRSTLLMNTANQITTNTQAVMKDLFDLQNSYGEDPNSPHQKIVIARLNDNITNTPKLLATMQQGGEITDVSGNTYHLEPVTNASVLQDLQIAQDQWKSLSPLIEVYLKNATNISYDSRNDLYLAAEKAKVSSLEMSNVLNKLAQDVFKEAENISNTIRLVQLIGVAVILAYFAIFVFFFVRRLRDSDIQADEARRETREIMENVPTGLFLLDNEFKISQHHSKALSQIIGSENLGGQSLISTLRGRVSEKDLNTAKQFIEQLYNPRVKEKLVDDLNPLKKILVHDAASISGSSNRYLDFKFSRVYENKDIARILVNVNDVSEAVRLEQRLEKERHQTEMQIEMLTTVLNVEPSLIQSFILNTKTYIEKMNNILKNPGSTQIELENKINAIYREMHSLKGESSALKLQNFTVLASEAENILTNLRNKPRLTGNDFLPLTVHLDALLNLSNMIENLGQRIGTAFSTVDYTALQHLKTEDEEGAFTQSHLNMLAETNHEHMATQLSEQAVVNKVVNEVDAETIIETEPLVEPNLEPVPDTVQANAEVVEANIETQADTVESEINAETIEKAEVIDTAEHKSELILTRTQALAATAAVASVANLTSEQVNTVNDTSDNIANTAITEMNSAESLEDLANMLFDDEVKPTTTATEVATSTEPDHTAQPETVAMTAPVETVPALQRYTQFVQDVAVRQNKRVEVDSSAYHEVQLPHHLNNAVREIVMQLLKNAVVHGIERNIDRIADGKPGKGTITFAQEVIDGKLHLIVADDGNGINFEKIRAKLIAMGKYDEESVQDLDEQALIDHLFESGFSTKETVDEDAGRGVGMDIIKARIEEHHGEIKVQSEPGKFTRFVIYIPV